MILLLATRGVAQPSCPGDCDASGSTDLSDLDRAVRALFDVDSAACDAADLDGDGAVTAAELLRIRVAIVDPPDGCGTEPTPTATPLGGTPRSTWIPLTPLPGGERQEVAVTALDGRVYVIGGFTATGAGSSAVEVYDTTADQWDRAADLPTRRNHAGAAALDGFVYVVGGFVGAGFTPASDVYRYDSSMNEWSSRAALARPRGALALVALNGKLYATGGSGDGGSITDHASYDPAADEWTELAPLPSARNHLAAAAVDGYLYVIGGRRDGSGNVNTDAVDRYDPASNTWASRAPMPTARSGHAVALLAGRLVVMGGEVNLANPPTYVFPEVEVYDPAADSWIALDPMAVARHGIGAATVGDLVYVPGGATHTGFGATANSDALQILW
jgi:N-acetylneuraminic acid mutarotase